VNDHPDILVRDLSFPEGPRWHGDRLWFSDMHTHQVHTVTEGGDCETVCKVAGKPSGLGWLPQDGAPDAGRLLVVSMEDRRLLRLDPEGLVEFADLSPFATGHCNDMVVSEAGRAYVGNFGFDLHAGDATPVGAALVIVDRNGKAREAASELMFPNGSVITPDGGTLILSETFASRLTAFDIAADGRLGRRRTWAEVPGLFPDGCCLDEEGGIWLATCTGNQVIRVTEGGAITDRIEIETESFACRLGGTDGRTLFLCTAGTSEPEEAARDRTGRIEAVRVKYPRAGLP